MFYRLKALSLVCTLFVLLAPGSRAKAAKVTSQGLTLLDYRVSPRDDALLGDMLKVSFVLKNESSQPVNLHARAGAFVGVRWIGQNGQKRNRDFGYQHQGVSIAPGQSVTVQAEKVLDTRGAWLVFPACKANGKWADFEPARVSISVISKKHKLRPGKGGGGATVVPWRGRKLPIQILPPDNAWNQDVSALPKHPLSQAFLRSIGLKRNLHPDFGPGGKWNNYQPHGIPFQVVRKDQPPVPIKFRWAGESDPGPYPIPPDFQTEKSGDRHVIVLDYDARKLYEVYLATREGPGWKGGAGAVFDLASNSLRPLGWTSADAAGLPIFPAWPGWRRSKPWARYPTRFALPQGAPKEATSSPPPISPAKRPSPACRPWA